ncbi:MAG: hypothetical protein A4E27_00642 [Methanobacterium sp. PtaU1.Bin242]|jgi:DNA-directed RNA polymerase subunit RPC12/RpoP|nr:MAG: hypothetical protein A4E27_00642 [Methanobacterium sp. PtaU1.Bin242]
MNEDIYICGHCEKEMNRANDKIVYGCYKHKDKNIHCAYLCESCFDKVDIISWTHNLDN